MPRLLSRADPASVWPAPPPTSTSSRSWPASGWSTPQSQPGVPQTAHTQLGQLGMANNMYFFVLISGFFQRANK